MVFTVQSLNELRGRKTELLLVLLAIYFSKMELGSGGAYFCVTGNLDGTRGNGQMTF